MTLRFQGIAWLLQEPKTTFYSPRYSQESLSVRSQVLPFWTQPQVVLQLGQVEYQVLNSSPADAAKRSGDSKETKKLLQVTVRSLADVQRAQVYQTAARTQIIEVFVDVEHTRERLLRCLTGEVDQEEEESVEQGKKLIDDAFVALERAQLRRDKDAALRLYKVAEKGFWEAEKLLPDDRSRELVRTRRGDLQKTIRSLEEKADEVTTSAVVDISARLEELRRFAAEQDNATAKRDSKTDLAGRLAALKNEKAGPVPPVDDLAERLRRLKGSSGAVAVTGDDGLERMGAVDQIIEQVTDEIALGIDDEDENLDSDSDNERSSSPRSNSSESSEEKNQRCNTKKQ